jgi:hypothetical protein
MQMDSSVFDPPNDESPSRDQPWDPPDTSVGTIVEAFRLFFTTAAVMLPITLVVCIPASLLSSLAEMTDARVAVSVISSIAGMVVAGAMMVVVDRSQKRQETTVIMGLKAGIRSLWPLYFNGLVAGLLIGLGFLDIRGDSLRRGDPMVGAPPHVGDVHHLRGGYRDRATWDAPSH